MPAQIHYTVSMLRPETHRFDVTIEIQGLADSRVTLVLPAWAPGSYLLREFSRHIEGFRAETLTENPLTWQRVDKGTWIIDTAGASSLRARYQVYANDLSVRTSHLDETHGYFNGTNLFMYLDGAKERPATLAIESPAGWHASIALPQNDQGHYVADCYDTLVDSPAEVGTHRVLRFEVQGKPHEIALWGTGNENEEVLVRDFGHIVEETARFFDGALPYDRYLFIVHLGDRLGGGLEHRASTTIAADRWTFSPRADYEQFVRLALHEFFHTWHVKRIRPANLGPFDYTREVYTPLLWVMEGFTTYYDIVLLCRQGFVTPRRFLEMLADRIATFRKQPGRLIQSLEESSFTTWIKFYRQDENYVNSGISYYLKGSLVALILDMEIRSATGNGRSLDHVMRLLWEKYGRQEQGFSPEQFAATLEEAAGFDPLPYLERFVRGTEELPLEEWVRHAGLELEGAPAYDSVMGWTGLMWKTDNGRITLRSVLRDSPAEASGLMSNDQLIAVDGHEIKDEKFLNARLREKGAGEAVTFHLFRHGILLEKTITLASSPIERYRLRQIENASPLQREIFENWLGSPWNAEGEVIGSRSGIARAL